MSKTYDDLTPGEVLFPDVEVELTGSDGNAFAIMGAVSAAIGRHLRGTKTPQEISEIKDEFRREAMSGDYDHLLQTAMRTVTVL